MAWAELVDGKYRGVYRDAFGNKRTVRGRRFTNKKAAVRAASAAEEEARKATFRNPDAARMKWQDWCDKWWPRRPVAANTLRQDSYRRDKYLIPQWGATKLCDINRHDIKQWAVELSLLPNGREDDAGEPATLSNSQVLKIVHLLSASLSAAVDAEILQVNPAAKLKLPPPRPAVERFLTYEEYHAVLDELPTDRDKLIVETLAKTGQRWGELAGAHEHRLRSGKLHVVETWEPELGKIKPYPKGKKIRYVPVDADLEERLIAFDRDKTCGKPHTEGRCASGLLLSSPEGLPLDGHNWSQRVWASAVERAGIGYCRVHDLRHTFASWQIQAGASLAEVGRLLGHESPLTTQRYAHLGEVPSAAVLAALPGKRMPAATGAGSGAEGAGSGAISIPHPLHETSG
jgi:integrase